MVEEIEDTGESWADWKIQFPSMKGLGFRIEGLALSLDRSSHTLSSQVGDCEEGTIEGADNFTGAKLKEASFSNGSLPPSPFFVYKVDEVI